MAKVLLHSKYLRATGTHQTRDPFITVCSASIKCMITGVFATVYLLIQFPVSNPRKAIIGVIMFRDQ